MLLQDAHMQRLQVRHQGARLWVPRLKLAFIFLSSFTVAPTYQAPQTHYQFCGCCSTICSSQIGFGVSVCLSNTFTAITSTAHAPRRCSAKTDGMNSCRPLRVSLWEAMSVPGETGDTGISDGHLGHGRASDRSQPRVQKSPEVTWSAGWQGPGQWSRGRSTAWKSDINTAGPNS